MKIEIYYDDQPDDVVNKVNELLKSRDLELHWDQSNEKELYLELLEAKNSE